MTKVKTLTAQKLSQMKSVALIGHIDLLLKQNKAKKSQEKYKCAPCFHVRDR